MLATRREFLATSLSGLAVSSFLPADEPRPAESNSLAKEVGVTTSSLDAHIARDGTSLKPGQFRLLDLPKMLREELGMKVID